MFDTADKDKSGSISFDEFYSFLQNECKKEAAKHQDAVVVAAHDPIAQRQAQENLMPSPFRNFEKGVLDATGVKFVNGGLADATMNAQYVPGEINPIHMQTINSCPEMRAYYEKNPALVKEFFTHAYDQPRCARLLAENPEFAQAHQALAMRSVQAYPAATPFATAPAVAPQGY